MKRVVHWGFGSEMVLRNWVGKLQGEANVIEIDPTTMALGEAADKANDCDWLITSNHFSRSLADYQRELPECKLKHDFFSLVEKSRPKRKCFAVHDHSQPYVLNEKCFLNSFDLVVVPYQAGIPLDLRTQMIRTSSFDFEDPAPLQDVVVWFVSNVVLNLRARGFEGFVKYCCKVIQSGGIDAVKFPNDTLGWQLGDALQRLGVAVVAPDLSTDKVIRNAAVVVSSSCSGVAGQALLLGKPTIMLVESDVVPTSVFVEQTWYLIGVEFCESAEAMGPLIKKISGNTVLNNFVTDGFAIFKRTVLSQP